MEPNNNSIIGTITGTGYQPSTVPNTSIKKPSKLGNAYEKYKDWAQTVMGTKLTDEQKAKEEVFRQRAISAGYSPEEANFTIEKRRAQKNFMTKLAYFEAKALPAIMGTIGTVGGTGVGIATGGVVAPLTAGIAGMYGTSAGQMQSDKMLRQMGIRDESTEPMTRGDVTKKALVEGGINAAGNIAGTYIGKGINSILKGGLSLSKTGKKLEEARKLIDVKSTDVDSGILKKLVDNPAKPKYFRTYNLGGKTFQKSVDEVVETISKDATNLDDVIKNLDSIKDSLPPNVYETVNGAMRDYINPLQPTNVSSLAETYHRLRVLEPLKKKAAYGAAGSLGAGVVSAFILARLNKILNGFRGQ